MARVLVDNVFVDGVMYAADTTPGPEIAHRFGEHCWREVEDVTGPAYVLASGPPDSETTLVVEEVGPSMFAAVDSGGVKDDAPKPPVGVPPNKGGKDSGAALWLAYAAVNGVEVVASTGRDEIIAALETAGIPTV